MLRNQPIGRKLTVIAMVAAAAGLLLAAGALIWLAYQSELRASERNLQTIGTLMAANSTAALSFNDPSTATEVLATLDATPAIVRACLYAEGEPAVFASFQRPESADCQTGEVQLDGVVTARLPVQLLGETLGHLQLTATLAPVYAQLRQQVQLTLTVLIGSLLVTVPLMTRLQRMITDPVLHLGTVARQVSETRDYSLRAQDSGADEIGQLARDFNTMLARIQHRDADILAAQQRLATQVEETRTANRELEQTMDQLQTAQTQLVQTEKLASLGGLVAGVAHEINTPVGVGVTAASTLRAAAEQLVERLAAGTLKRSHLSEFTSTADDATRIILSNLHRASELVQSFKQVAVDQSSAERRHFNLKEYVDEVLLSLTPRLKKTPHQVTTEIPEDLMLDSYPGALAQILTNLVTNALIHAFDDRHPGTITVQAQAEGEQLRLICSDDGCGMSPDHRKKLFDPFFTTKRGAGGSGLGMHIVFNLVTQALQGRITVETEPGQGTRYDMLIPLRAPDRPAPPSQDPRS